ncbi:putative alpha-1,2-mannosidase [Mycetocola sp. BIGb0189]|uniref:GH92 family glycosyl hydrolase n=1 Tax=Mycetocola sp. BIGb0189 TaxID=2940604 RepID=UPI00216704A2|nr:GH92 family glycosyl hydrolase [Mycetocola sp. BIGb0189]MCS4276528.1 putative alpha-1,2-mannosidase [Mycetocola sp. BIGb0189]
MSEQSHPLAPPAHGRTPAPDRGHVSHPLGAERSARPRPLRRLGALGVGTALVLGGFSPVLFAAPASAAPAEANFASSFEATDPAALANTVEQRDGKPWQQNVQGVGLPDLMKALGSVSASAENVPNEAARFAADGDAGTKWLTFTTAATLDYTFTTAQTAVTYKLVSGNDAPERDPRTWRILGSNNGTDWTELDSQTDQSWKSSERGVAKEFTLKTTGAFSKYRLDIASNQSGGLIQLADFLLAGAIPENPVATPINTEVGSGPSDGFNIKARVGFTGVRALKYSGAHTAEGRGYASNVIYKDVSIPVTDTSRLSYLLFPELTGGDLQYPSTHTAVDLHFTDGTYLSDLSAKDQYGYAATAQGQGTGNILYPKQWNSVRVALGRVAQGKTIDRFLLSYDNPGATASTAFSGWLDDLKIEATPAAIDGSSLTHYVDTRRGTNSSGSFSRGSNEAITSVPNGFNFLVPVTNARATSRTYQYQQGNDAQNRTPFQGLAISHQPSPWMGDRNQFSVMPVPGAGAPSGNPGQRSTTLKHENETAQPDYYGVKLDNKVSAEMTPSDHGMVMRFTFDGNDGNVVFDSPKAEQKFTIAADGTVTGWVDNGSGFRVGQSRMFISGKFDQTPRSLGTPAGAQGSTMFAAFDTSQAKTVTLRMATSLISLDQATKNLGLEIGNQSFDQVRASAQKIWNDRLSAITVEGASETELVSLYSNLYRLNVYPNVQHENTGTADQPVYKYASPVNTKTGTATDTKTDAQIRDGKMYVNNGFWDTYRTVWPAYAMLYPDVAADLVDGFVEQYRAGGWVARWSSPGYADIMTGTSSDVAFADAYLRGVKLDDPLGTYDAAVKNATVVSTSSNATGRKSIGTSTFLGYTPASEHESVSWGLEGMINDYGIGNMAAALAEDPATPEERRAQLREEAEYFTDRATTYVNMFDPAINFFQARNADGSFQVAPENYDPTTWWGPYTETNGWNFAFHAPQDPAGLAALYGGRAGLEKKLDDFFSIPETSAGPIHEEIEARDARFGQWGISNQVSHHIPFLYNAVGAPAKAQAITREAIKRSFAGSEIGQGYPGDEDNGEMSTWYLFSALGLYPLQVGSSELTIGSPLYTKATVKLGDKTLVINAPNNSDENIYVQSLRVNGKAYSSTSIDSNLLAQGGTLDFVMGSKPSAWGTAEADAPPSLSTGEHPASPLLDSADPKIARVTSRDGENTANLVDNNAASQMSFASKTPQITVAYQGPAQSPTFYTLTSGTSTATAPTGWTLEGSNDGKTWSVVDTRQNQKFDSALQTRPFKIAQPGSFAQFRLNVTSGGDSVALGELELLAHASDASGSQLTVSPAQALGARSGVAETLNLGGISGGDAKGYTVSVNWGDGSAAGTATLGSPTLGVYPVSGSHTYAEPGEYRVTVTVTDGASTASAILPITVDYLEPGSLRAAFDSQCIADDGVGANCDAKGISFPRKGLADGGLTQGVEHGVPGTDLRFTIPVIPAGAPDNATGAGQVIRPNLGEDATKLSFIGAATEKNQDTTALVTFTDGSTETIPLQLSDWTKGGNSQATPLYGNIEVVKSSYRLAGPNPSNVPSFFFSTVPYSIPAGKTVETITLPVQPGQPGVEGRVHVFAIASNGVAADTAFTATAGKDIAVVAGEKFSADLATVTQAAGAVAPKARVQWGDGSDIQDVELGAFTDGSATITAEHTFTEPGTYPVVVTVYGTSGTQQLRLSAEVTPVKVPYSPTITVAPAGGVRAGGEATITGAGFAPNEKVSVSVATDPAITQETTANAEGEISLTVTVPKNTSAGALGVTAVGETSVVPASGTLTVLENTTTPVYTPQVRSNAQNARVGDLVEITGEGFAPGEKITVVLHSDPITLGTATADPRGGLVFSFTVPKGAEVGQHEIVVTGATSAVDARMAFEILPAQVPGDGGTGNGGPGSVDPVTGKPITKPGGGIATTGAPESSALIAGLGLLTLIAGAGVFLLRRRRATQD